MGDVLCIYKELFHWFTQRKLDEKKILTIPDNSYEFVYETDCAVLRPQQSLKSYASKKGWHYNLEPYCKIFENDFYCVYAV